MAVKSFTMQTPRALVATDPMRFGRGRLSVAERPEEHGRGASDDVRLFATTFAAGFLFVSILIA
jgi:hypothetical protein